MLTADAEQEVQWKQKKNIVEMTFDEKKKIDFYFIMIFLH